MRKLPVIVGFGGYNAAGRSSFHHAYHRTILDSLPEHKQAETLTNLAVLMKLVSWQDNAYVNDDGESLTAEQVAEKYKQHIIENTLVRRIGKEHFDVDNVVSYKDVSMDCADSPSFTIRKKELPQPTPEGWQVSELDDGNLEVIINNNLSVKVESFRSLEVQAAGQLPTGFNPGAHYASRFHPRGLQMSILGASDAIRSIGIDWKTITNAVAPDEISVYAASSMGQNDGNGNGGVFQSRLKSSRTTAKQLALGLSSMPADFVNAYVCGNVGSTGSITGACASFLYNLRLGVEDILAGKCRVALVGSSEAPVLPEIIEGYGAMGALATNEKLKNLDNTDTVDYTRAARPFGENCGFTLGESAQYFVLMDDELAIELGAQIHGAVNNVFAGADGFKKSISSPGAGNYITLAKAVASARAIVGEDIIRNNSFVQAHGSSTPQNRVTESYMLNLTAEGFGISNWPITAIKSYVGHPLASASGDQLASVLGIFHDGILPGIKTVDKIADDVHQDHLSFCLEDTQAEMHVSFLNTKGFGGNNATASVLSGTITKKMLAKRYGEDAMAAYEEKNKVVVEAAQSYDQAASQGNLDVIYNFGNDIIDNEKIVIGSDKLELPENSNSVNLELENPYADMTDI